LGSFGNLAQLGSGGRSHHGVTQGTEGRRDVAVVVKNGALWDILGHLRCSNGESWVGPSHRQGVFG
jgi:hypothetical protein